MPNTLEQSLIHKILIINIITKNLIFEDRVLGLIISKKLIEIYPEKKRELLIKNLQI